MLSKRNVPLALLLLCVCLLYSNSFGNGFHFDDFHAVTDNPAVRSLGNLPRIFRDATAFSVLPANQTYRPVVTASLALDYALGHGYAPFWFHMSTLLWFLALLVLLFSFAELIFARAGAGTAAPWLAMGVAAWFGVHPVMAETVNYVIQRGDLYCTLGCVAAVVLFARYPERRKTGVYLLPFALAMLSKPPAAVLPLLLLLYVFFFEAEELPAARRWVTSALAAVPAAVATGMLLWLQAAMTPKSYAPTILSAAAYRSVQPFVWMRYCAALLLPLHLNVDTDLQPIQTWNTDATLGVLFVLALLAAAVLAATRRRLFPIAFGLLWFVITQLPTSLYTLSEVENDHRMFFSFPGLMMAVVWALYLAYQTLERRIHGKATAWLPQAAALGCGVLLCGYAYGAHRRNQVWHSEASLWADDAAKSPHNGRGLMNYGLIKMNRGDYAGALALFQQALLYTPNYPTLEINLGVVNGLMADSGQPARKMEAQQHFERALALAPLDDLPHAYFGRWLLTHGDPQGAIAQLKTAVALNGQRPMQRDLLLSAYTQMGDTAAARELAASTLSLMPEDRAARAVLQGTASGTRAPGAVDLINASLQAYREGRFEASIAAAQAALRIDPQSAEAWNNIGAGYGGLKEWDQGIAAEQQALQLNPGLTIAANNLRWFLAQKAAQTHTGAAHTDGAVLGAAALVNRSLELNRSGHYADSLAAARQAIALDPGSAEAWNNIAADEEAMGKWPEAIAAAQRAIALRPDFQLARNNLQWSLQQQAKAAQRP